ncbi:hypothetical protein HDV01_007022 [Terramyces sp. JEL0728]|nr:hypothetical protein HDV01_007022 [Terramyces sp. JEL0728]
MSTLQKPREQELQLLRPPVFLLFGYFNDFMIVCLFLFVDYLIAKALVQIAEFKVVEQNKDFWPDYVVDEKKAQDIGETIKANEKQEAVKEEEEQETEDNRDTVEIDQIEEIDSLPPVVQREWKDPNEDETLIPTDPTRPIDIPLVPTDIGSIYLFNPFSIITFLSRSINIFTSLSIVYSILFALKGKRRLSMLCCAISCWLSLYPLVLLAPCIFILKQRKGIVEFVFYLAGLHFLSYLFNNDYLESYKTIIFITDLRPNVGLFWYFFQEVFEQFRIFFYSVFHVNSFIFTIPILIKFSHKPILASGLIVAFISMFKSYPSVTDIPLYTTLLLVNTELLKYTGYIYLSISGFLYCCILGPLFFNLWIYNGSGNANFYYAITLLWGVTQTMFCVDLIFAQIKRDFEQKSPGWRKSRVDLIYQ